MSRSVFQCQRCGHVLGHRRHSGSLRVAADVTVVLHKAGAPGQVVRLICPACGHHRYYRDGTVIVLGRGDSQRPALAET
jgi:predicted RNA-binding Zn-ribbon protein involved in translation (DUF1610 family)